MIRSGFSTDPAWKTLSDPEDNTEKDAAVNVHVKPATLRSSAEDSGTRRRKMEERMRYDVRSLHHCVKEKQVYLTNGNQLYEHYVCKHYSILCAPIDVKSRCEPTGYAHIPALKMTVVTGCKCRAD